MDVQMSLPWVRTEQVTFEGRMALSLDGESVDSGRVTLTSHRLMFEPESARSCCPDVEVPLDVITHAQLTWLRNGLEVRIGDVHRLVLRGEGIHEMHTTLTGLLGAAALH